VRQRNPCLGAELQCAVRLDRSARSGQQRLYGEASSGTALNALVAAARTQRLGQGGYGTCRYPSAHTRGVVASSRRPTLASRPKRQSEKSRATVVHVRCLELLEGVSVSAASPFRLGTLSTGAVGRAGACYARPYA
jgi:hypothetical protein